MKYMLLIYGNQERWESVGADELAEIIRQTDALNQALLESGACSWVMSLGRCSCGVSSSAHRAWPTWPTPRWSG